MLIIQARLWRGEEGFRGRKIAPEGYLLFGGACLSQVKVGDQWPALEVGSTRPLVIPIQTKLAAASPFHCCLVSPGSKKAFVHAVRTMLTNGVSRILGWRSVTAVTTVCGNPVPLNFSLI